MAKKRTESVASATLLDEYRSRADQGEELAAIQADIEHRIRESGAEDSDFQLELIQAYSRAVHDHTKDWDQARAIADRMIADRGTTDTVPTE